MTRPAVWLPVAVVALLAGCGNGSSTSMHDQSPSAATTPKASATEVVERVDWRLAESPQGDSLRLVVAIPSAASCGSFDHADVSETGDVVVVETLIRRVVPGEGGDCTADLGFKKVAVNLDRELGDRQLEGCDPPPGGDVYFDEPVPPGGCTEAVVQPR